MSSAVSSKPSTALATSPDPGAAGAQVLRPPADEVCGSFSFVFLGDNRPDPTLGMGHNWNIILDECPACGGVWLDADELKAIRAMSDS